MTREIKFRAWDKEMNKMLFFDFKSLGGWDDGLVYLNDMDSSSFITNEKYIIMQYTGLKDKNGVDIYEGDIYLKTFDDIKIPLIVKYNMGTFDLDNTNEKEVIGSIYQNSELLK